MNNQFFLPMVVTAVVVGLIASITTIALSEVFEGEPAGPVATPTLEQLPPGELDALKAQQEDLQARLADMETLFDVMDARMTGMAFAPGNGSVEDALGDAPQPAVDETPIPDGDHAARLARLERTLSTLEARMQGLQQEVVEYQEDEPERLEEYEQQRVQEFREQAETALRSFADRARRSMMDRITTQLDLDAWQTEAFQEESSRMFERMGQVGERLRSGEITQDQAREEMAQVREETDTEMQRILTQDQYDRLQEMTNGEQNPLGRFLPGGGNPQQPGNE